MYNYDTFVFVLNHVFYEFSSYLGLLNKDIKLYTKVYKRTVSEFLAWYFIFNWSHLCVIWASQVVLLVKNPPANARDVGYSGLIPGSRRFPGRGHGNPHQYSCLENPTDRGTVGRSP